MSIVNKERLLEEFFELVQIDSETKDERAIADVFNSENGSTRIRCY